MAMSPRERLMALIVGVLLSLIAIQWFVKRQILTPLAQKQDQLESKKTEFGRLQVQQEQAREAEADLNRWRTTALPADLSRASTLYHDYLRGLLEKSGIKLPSISPESPSNRGDQFRVLPFHVRAKAGMDEIVRFLHAFHQAPLLHQIQHISIAPILQDGKLSSLDVSISIEAVSVSDAQAKDKLPMVAPDAAPRWSVPALDDLALIKVKNLFQPTKFTAGNGKEGGEDRKDDYVVRGTMVADARGTLLVVNQKTNKTIMVPEGDYLRVAGLEAKVLTVELGQAVVEIDGERGKLRLGESLASWTKLGSNQAPR
jgi:hypothetical protein